MCLGLCFQLVLEEEYEKRGRARRGENDGNTSDGVFHLHRSECHVVRITGFCSAGGMDEGLDRELWAGHSKRRGRGCPMTPLRGLVCLKLPISFPLLERRFKQTMVIMENPCWSFGRFPNAGCLRCLLSITGSPSRHEQGN